MANVPDTDTFTLIDVINVVGSSSLSEAFINANDSNFDPNYKGSKDRLTNFRNYQDIYLTLDVYDLYFSFEGYPCANSYVTVTSNTDWYVEVDTSEILSAYCYPTSGSGNDTVYFYCNETNYDNYIHASGMHFYRTSDNSELNGCAVVENAYGQYCS